MTRVKRGTTAHKRRKNVLKHTKGFMWGRKSKYKAAKEAIQHAWTYAYRDRRNKKREIRRLWQNRINFASRELGVTYSRFIQGTKKKKIEIDRKILSQLIEEKPEIFQKIVEEVKNKE
jgi:large subunit ribosomal protein L20